MDLVVQITRMVNVPADAARLGIQQVSLTAIARESARQLRDMAQDRGVEVIIAADLPHVAVDLGRLELMLTNLLSNAIKYSDPTKDRRFVEVMRAHADGICAFQVRDNGVGMTSEQARDVFKPFYRAHADRDAELASAGLGLGLSIVHDCARAIGASVAVHAAPGQGAVFMITLPDRACAPVHTPA